MLIQSDQRFTNIQNVEIPRLRAINVAIAIN